MSGSKRNRTFRTCAYGMEYVCVTDLQPPAILEWIVEMMIVAGLKKRSMLLFDKGKVYGIIVVGLFSFDLHEMYLSFTIPSDTWLYVGCRTKTFFFCLLLFLADGTAKAKEQL